MSESTRPVIKDLGAGLILRRSSPADAESLATFCTAIHGEDPGEREEIGAWTRDLLTRPHPTLRAEDFSVIAEVTTGRIISTMNLIPQTWTYEEIPLQVGRPELVGTLAEFRNRGLIRQQFEEIHRWSAARGDMLQAITGIPFYYRQFGYEMALDLDGARSGSVANVPELRAGEREPYVLRAASEADIPFLSAVYNAACLRYPIAFARDETIWRYELTGRSDAVRTVILVIERATGEPVGALGHRRTLGNAARSAIFYELQRGASWLEVTPSVVRHLWKTGEQYARREGRRCKAFTLSLGEMHPAYEALGDRLPDVRVSYAWYMRVPDLPGLLTHIAPALEKRLADSIACGYSGVERVSFYRSGLRLIFESGRLKAVEPWQPGPGEREGEIGFPGLVFLQLLFGYRSLAELRQSFADCWWNSNETRLLFSAMFPKRSSQVYALS